MNEADVRTHDGKEVAVQCGRPEQRGSQCGVLTPAAWNIRGRTGNGSVQTSGKADGSFHGQHDARVTSHAACALKVLADVTACDGEEHNDLQLTCLGRRTCSPRPEYPCAPIGQYPWVP
jgi:hypothetical protein